MFPGKEVVFSCGLPKPRKTVDVGGAQFDILGPEHYKLNEYFAPGLYVREIFMPAGHFICGEVHKTEHLNTVLSGEVLVMMEGKLETITGPRTFVSKAGVSKRLLILQDTHWMTMHPQPDDCRDIEILRARLIEPSTVAIDVELELEQIRKLIR